MSRKKRYMSEAAARRTVTNSGYSNHGANRSKATNKGYLTDSRDARHDIDKNFRILRERAVDLQQGVPLANGALKTNKTNVIGAGLRFKSNIRFEELGMTIEEKNAWERKTEREFELWAKHCDAREQTNFYGLQALAYFEKQLYGDVFVNLPMVKTKKSPYMLKLQIIESIMVSSPSRYIGQEEEDTNDVIHGIKFNEYGAPIGFYVYTGVYQPGLTDDARYKFVPKYGAKSGRLNMIQLVSIERSGQVRGIPLLAPVIEDIKLLGRYEEAEVVKVLVNALMSVFIESETPEDGVPFGESIDYDEQIDPLNDETIEMGNGTVNVLAPGETVKVAEKSPIPTDFKAFVETIISHIGAALEIPYEILTKKFTASYSASRAALLEYWKSVEAQRSEFITQFCNPIYEEWLTEAILLGRIHAPGFFDDPIIKEAWLGASWYGPSQGQLDPKKEAEAAEIRVKSAFSTRAKEAAELTGMDYENEILPQRIREHNSMEEGGLLNEQGQQIQVSDSSNSKRDDNGTDD